MFKMFKYPGDSAMIKMTVRWQFAKCIQVLQHCQEAWNLFWKPDEKLTKGFQAAVLRTVGAKMSRQCLGVCGDVRSVVSSMEDSSNLHKSRLHTVLVWPSRDIQCASMHFHAFSIFNILQHPSTLKHPISSTAIPSAHRCPLLQFLCLQRRHLHLMLTLRDAPWQRREASWEHQRYKQHWTTQQISTNQVSKLSKDSWNMERLKVTHGCWSTEILTGYLSCLCEQLFIVLGSQMVPKKSRKIKTCTSEICWVDLQKKFENTTRNSPVSPGQLPQDPGHWFHIQGGEVQTY